MLLAKPRSRLEVVNDANGDLVCFYRCVRFHQEALLTELEFVLNSREEFTDFIDQPGLTDIQRSARWFFRNKTCFGGTDMETFGTAALGGGAAHGSRHARMEAIRALSWRLDRVLIEHLDWAKCIERYDRPTTFFFLDPPYTGCGETMYRAWTETDVRGLRERLDRLRGPWLLTLNDAPFIRALFADCKVRAISRAKGINAKAEVKEYRELIIQPRAAAR